MLDLGRMHRVLMSSHQENLPTKKAGQSLLFSLEYHLNEIEKNKYKSIKKYLPDFGFEMTLAQENVLRIEAVPEALKESQVIKFLEKIFEVLEYRTEVDFYKYFNDLFIYFNCIINKINKNTSKLINGLYSLTSIIIN